MVMTSERERIGEALRFIDPADRDTWVRMGMAIKSAVGESGFAASAWASFSTVARRVPPSPPSGTNIEHNRRRVKPRR